MKLLKNNMEIKNLFLHKNNMICENCKDMVLKKLIQVICLSNKSLKMLNKNTKEKANLMKDKTYLQNSIHKLTLFIKKLVRSIILSHIKFLFTLNNIIRFLLINEYLMSKEFQEKMIFQKIFKN